MLEDALAAQRLIALERGRVVFDGSPYAFLQKEELIEQLGVEVPAIAKLVEMLTKSGLAEPGEVASLEQLIEILTVLEQRKDNETT
jgi:hypothetical protein